MIPSSRGTSVSLAAIVDTVNARDINEIKIEKHAPVAGTETVEPVPAGKPFGITLAGLSIARERSKNSRCSIAVKSAKISASGRFPNESFLHEVVMSRRL